tara:strand:+ start:655 stop:1437 length:783 start_codon:yes stop_codon:yes gene_type:complete
MNRLVFIFLIFGIQNLSSQVNNSSLIRGRVSTTDSISVSSIHIINKTRGSATITDDKGYFEIFSSTNDTLIFSAVQFGVKVIVVNNKILESKEIVIPMEKFVNKLSEVVVRPHYLSGNLFKDFENSGVKPPLNFYNMGVPGFTGKRKEKIVTEKQLIVGLLLLPISGSLPIEPIYKHISGYYKRLKKKRKLDIEFDVVANLIKFYGLDYFIETHKLSEDEVYEFVSGTYNNFPLKESFKKNEHNLVMEYFEQNKIRVFEK